MRINIRPVAKFLYGFLGAVFLIVGTSISLLPTGLLPDTVKNVVMNFGQGDSNTLHIIQELGSILVFVGLIAFWFTRHYENSKYFIGR